MSWFDQVLYSELRTLFTNLVHINDPSDVFDRNPYDRNNVLPTAYTESTTILNIDTFSLAAEESPQFQGFITQGMVLRGANSGAEAVVTDVRLVTDRVGTLIGSFRVPSSIDPQNPVPLKQEIISSD